MRVTFVSECKKKSLLTTRRVLDSFANRIGNNTWQTMITMDGLNAVEQLLKSTATKNTAVSCHTQRGNNFSEFVWIVGNKRKFNEYGHVPVNYTDKMPHYISEDDMKKTKQVPKANSKGQPLAQHCFAVAVLSAAIVKSLGLDEQLVRCAFRAGFLHDIGKVDPVFQEHICKKPNKKQREHDDTVDGTHIVAPKKFTFENHPRHNEISWLIARHILPTVTMNNVQRDNIYHAIFWHHCEPFRKKRLVSGNDIVNLLPPEAIYDLKKSAQSLLIETAKLSKEYSCTPIKFDENLHEPDFNLLLPPFKIYDENTIEHDVADKILINVHNNSTRTAVITADRIISALTPEQLAAHIANKTIEILIEPVHTKNNLVSGIDTFLSKFITDKRRNDIQRDAALKLSKCQNVAVIAGPAGVGKTNIGLHAAKISNASTLLWVVPRKTIATGILTDLLSDSGMHDVKIEIKTGDIHQMHHHGEMSELTPDGKFTGEIIITTIDQLLNFNTSHQLAPSLLMFLNSFVIFDEFHEVIEITGINLMFMELVKHKQICKNAGKTLLMSATPSPVFCTNFLNIHDDDIIAVETFNKSKYRFELVTYDENNIDNPLFAPVSHNKKTIIISNTAIKAQQAHLKNQQDSPGLVFTGKITQSHKEKKSKEIYERFGNKSVVEGGILRSGPGVRASLNISCEHMRAELNSPENTLQAPGRLDRLGQNSDINIMEIVCPDALNNSPPNRKGATANFLSQLFSLNRTLAWHNYLKEYKLYNSIIDLPTIYAAYFAFYTTKAGEDAARLDINQSFKKGAILINNVLTRSKSIKRAKNDDSSPKTSANSMRGNNVYVAMAIINMTFDGYTISEEYIGIANTNLTVELTRINGEFNADKNLIDFARKKQHQIRGTVKPQPNKDYTLITASRSSETPIFTSFTPTDLEKIGGIQHQHPHALFYVIDVHGEPVGMMTEAEINS